MVRLTPPISSDVKIPDWAMGKADEVWTALANNEANGREAETALFARALLAAEQRGRKAGLEEAAKVAERMLIFADTTSGADREITAAIRSLGEQK